jgi:hypothetical protein
MKKSTVARKIANENGYSLGRNGKNCYYLISPVVNGGDYLWFDSMKAAVDYARANPAR